MFWLEPSLHILWPIYLEVLDNFHFLFNFHRKIVGIIMSNIRGVCVVVCVWLCVCVCQSATVPERRTLFWCQRSFHFWLIYSYEWQKLLRWNKVAVLFFRCACFWSYIIVHVHPLNHCWLGLLSVFVFQSFSNIVIYMGVGLWVITRAFDAAAISQMGLKVWQIKIKNWSLYHHHI